MSALAQCVYIYIYIYRERERDSEKGREDNFVQCYLFHNDIVSRFQVIIPFDYNNSYLILAILKKRYICLIDYNSHCLVGCGCWIHRLLLCRRVRPSQQRMSEIWHKTIWWRSSSNTGIFGEYGVPLHYHSSQVHSGPEW